MRNIRKLLGYAIAFAVLASGVVFAQATATHNVNMSVNAFSRLGVTVPGTPVTLVLLDPGTAGAIPADAVDSTNKYLQYSAVTNGTAQKITVGMGVADVLLTGTTLSVVSGATGTTNRGTPAVAVLVSSTAHDLITAIQSCATGVGGAMGPALTFTLSVSDVELLNSTSAAIVTLTYTIL